MNTCRFWKAIEYPYNEIDLKDYLSIARKNGDVVMISLDDWEAIQETLYLVSIPNMRESILKESKESLDEFKTSEEIGRYI